MKNKKYNSLFQKFSLKDTEENIEATAGSNEKINDISITNYSDFQTENLDWTAAEKKLYEYNFINGIKAETSTILNSYQMQAATEFYLENDDGSLVMITWIPSEQEIKVSSCPYTKDALLNTECIEDENTVDIFEIMQAETEPETITQIKSDQEDDPGEAEVENVH